jgi:hypothetical protein
MNRRLLILPMGKAILNLSLSWARRLQQVTAVTESAP